MDNHQPIEKLLDDGDVAGVLKVKPETVADWRKSNTVALPFVRIGPRLVRYRPSDLKAFIDAGHQPAVEGV